MKCRIAGCGNGGRLVRRMCQKHYRRWVRHRDPLVEYPAHRRVRDPRERFWEKVSVGHPLGCWLWTAAVNNKGYGRFHMPDGTTEAHRFSYETLRGPIEKELQIDHLCRERRCVNPDHLEAVTIEENLRRRPMYLRRTA